MQQFIESSHKHAITYYNFLSKKVGEARLTRHLMEDIALGNMDGRLKLM
uniref:Uncharacterized protein n=1 Tax=Rhizophora mucronata TaxID=61149 RepID=A0A2P2PVX8_RHIMU